MTIRDEQLESSSETAISDGEGENSPPIHITPRRTSQTNTNMSGGRYQQGRQYAMPTKLAVGDAYIELLYDMYPKIPTSRQIAKKAKVGKTYVLKVLKEIEEYGQILDPDVIREHNNQHKEKNYKLNKCDAAFLLSLRAEDPSRSNLDYIQKLNEQHNKLVCSATITNFFGERFPHSGRFCQPNLIPLDKWKPSNLAAFVEFYEKLKQLPDRKRFNFLDEKHIVNKDVLQTKVRRDPLSGYTPHIRVSGDFREAYNIFACISADTTKPRPIFYNIRKDNGSALSFMEFVSDMIISRYLKHNDIVVMDNAAIHSGKEAQPLADLLWDFEIDGRPLHILCFHCQHVHQNLIQ